MARPKNTAQRQEQIVSGLLEVMAERGYERASVAEVARAAGLSPGVVHYHFGTKLEILLRLIAWLADRLQARLEARLARRTDPRSRLRAFVDVHLARGADADPRAVACWVAISAEAIRQPEVAAAQGAVLDAQLQTLTVLVRDALRAADRSTAQARPLAAATLAAIQGYLTLSASAPGLVPSGSAAPTVNRLLAGVL